MTDSSAQVPETQATAPTKSYILSCHCQKNILELTLPLPTPAPDHGTPFTDNGVCDCSHCLKRRVVWFFAPPGSVKVLKGGVADGSLKPYRFGSKSWDNMSCSECGTFLPGASADSKGPIPINLRAIRNPDFDLWQLPLKQYSGADRDPPYDPPQIPAGAEAYLAERAKHYPYETKVYVGGCHCKAVTFAVLHKPLEEVELVDCACSICTGNGVIWAYPGRRDVFFHPSASDSKPWQPDPSLVTRYTFGKGTNEHVVCNQCFCQIFEAREVLDRDGGEGWEEDNGNPGTFGINIALYNNITDYLVESKTGLLKGLLKLTDARNMEPVYQVKV